MADVAPGAPPETTEEMAPGSPLGLPEPVIVGDSARAKTVERFSHPMRIIRSIYSPLWKEEAKELFIISWPVVLANFLFFLPVLVSLLFASTQGTAVMDAVALALTFVNLTGTSVGMGLTTAYDTLLSQTFGGDNPKRVGVIVQRGILIIMLFCFPCWALYVNIEGVMLGLHEPPEVSRMGGQYVLVFAPGLPGLILAQIIFKYLQNQNIVKPPMVAALLMNVINAIYHAIFMLGFKLGAPGAGLSLGLTFWTTNALLIFYIWYRGLHRETWDGWSMDSLQEWGTFTKLAIPGLLMMALEFWNYELGTLFAGQLGKNPLAAQAIMYQFINLAFMVPFGVSLAASIRIGQHLGEGKPEIAKVVSRLCITFIFFTGLLTVLIYTAFRTLIPPLFTDEQEVLDMCSTLFILVAISGFFDSFQGVCSGVLRGCGRQRIGAGVNFIGFYLIGLPMGLSLMLKTELGVQGFWIGTIFGVAFQAITFNIVVAFTKWEKESDLAKQRAGLKVREEEIDKGFAELSTAPKHYSKEGETVVIESTKPQGHAVTETSNEVSITTVTVASGDITSDTQVIIVREEEVLATLKHLPLKKLLIRRGLTLLAMVSILLIGIILRLAIPLPRVNITNSTN